MHGLPESFDPSVFVGRTLEQVSFVSNAIFLNFSDSFQIRSESHIRYQTGADTEQEDDVVPVRHSTLMLLTNHEVERATVAPPGTLTLEFDNGGWLLVEDEQSNYESYSISTPGQEIFV